MQLSPHFSLEEFQRSSTATRLGIDNTIGNSEIRDNLKALCVNVLEPLRVAINKPIIIGSGYRCPALNAAVGGVKNSNHLTGCAADIHINSNKEGKEWMGWIEDNCAFDELIWETSDRKHYWIHVAFRPSGNRQKVVSYLLKPSAKTR